MNNHEKFGIKSKSLVHSLLNLEMGNVGNTYSMKLFHNLLSQKTVTFKKCASISSKKRIVYANGRLFLDNYKECYTLTGKYSLPSLLFKIDLQGHKRIADHLGSFYPLPRDKVSNFKPIFLGLTADNYLLCFNYSTGELLKEIYLGDSIKYEAIEWATMWESIVLYSTLRSKRQRVHQTVAIFTIYPLEFVCAFNVEKDIFGSDIKEADVSEGFLLIHIPRFNNWYSLDHIMDPKNFECTHKLGEVCEHLTAQNFSETPQKVGVHGIPINITFNRDIPILYQKECTRSTFGGYPHWHCAYLKDTKHETLYFLEDLKTGKIEKFELENARDVENIEFDSESKLLSKSDDQIIVYNLKENCAVTKIITFRVKVPTETPHKENAQQERRTTKRNVKKVVSYNEHIDERTIFSSVLDPDMKIFGILGVEREKRENGKVILYNYENGKVINYFDVGFQLYEENEYELLMECETIVVLEVKDNNYNTAHVYRLIQKETLEHLHYHDSNTRK